MVSLLSVVRIDRSDVTIGRASYAHYLGSCRDLDVKALIRKLILCCFSNSNAHLSLIRLLGERDYFEFPELVGNYLDALQIVESTPTDISKIFLIFEFKDNRRKLFVPAGKVDQTIFNFFPLISLVDYRKTSNQVASLREIFWLLFIQVYASIDLHFFNPSYLFVFVVLKDIESLVLTFGEFSESHGLFPHLTIQTQIFNHHTQVYDLTVVGPCLNDSIKTQQLEPKRNIKLE
mmetsp:Transcript_7163/g.6255  ORF Transcript_7163/g.6255 Transcript_7163/m.6255 type:complete len:233 (+) Transcript_7163:30-728(+)